MHIALSLLMVTVVGLQGTPRGLRWWLDPAICSELALTGKQVAALDEEYMRTLGQRRLLRRAFDAANVFPVDTGSASTTSSRRRKGARRKPHALLAAVGGGDCPDT